MYIFETNFSSKKLPYIEKIESGMTEKSVKVVNEFVTGTQARIEVSSEVGKGDGK